MTRATYDAGRWWQRAEWRVVLALVPVFAVVLLLAWSGWLA